MKKSLRVWFPPKGDNRLLHFQEEIARKTELPVFSVFPPFLFWRDETVEHPPFGMTISLGGWTLQPEGLLLIGPQVGSAASFFWMATPEKEIDENFVSQLPPPPNLSWTKGRIGVIDLELPEDSWDFVIYEVRSLTPWRV